MLHVRIIGVIYDLSSATFFFFRGDIRKQIFILSGYSVCHRIDSVGDPINNIPIGGMDDPERTGPGGMDGGRRSLNPSFFAIEQFHWKLCSFDLNCSS